MSKIAKTLIFSVTMMLSFAFADTPSAKKSDLSSANQEKLEWIAEQNALHAGSAVNVNDLPNFRVIELDNLRDIVNGTIAATTDGYPSEGSWTLGVYVDGTLYFAYLNDEGLYGWQVFTEAGETQSYTPWFDTEAVYSIGTTDSYGDGGTTVTVTGDDGTVWVTAASTSGETWDDFSVPATWCTEVKVTFNLVDSWGDGWNGNSLLFGDEVMTVSGSEASFTYCLEDGNYTYTYDAAGTYQSENSWTVTLEDGTVLSSAAAGTDGGGYCVFCGVFLMFCGLDVGVVVPMGVDNVCFAMCF